MKDGYLNGNGIIATMMLNSLLGMRKGIFMEMLAFMHIWIPAAIWMFILQLLQVGVQQMIALLLVHFVKSFLRPQEQSPTQLDFRLFAL